jgi:predicted ester cyclase
MAAEQNLKSARLIIDEAFNTGSFASLDSLFKPGYVEHQYGLHTDVEGLKNDIAFLRRAFPDFHLTIERLVADGEYVWMHMTARGTNLGGLVGPANGKTFEVTVFDLLRFEDGLIVEHWGSPDRFAQMSQLGLLPAQKPA